jgi:hypothetical protein
MNTTSAIDTAVDEMRLYSVADAEHVRVTVDDIITPTRVIVV